MTNDQIRAAIAALEDAQAATDPQLPPILALRAQQIAVLQEILDRAEPA